MGYIHCTSTKMRTLIVLCLLGVLFGNIACEYCTSSRGCNITVCPQTAGSHRTCLDGVCTCYIRNSHGITCTTQPNCLVPTLRCRDNQDKHCIDGYCHCGA